ncbi:MAG: hypothetical protein AVDCRST_MAG39-1112, partial [uncultured Sphingomonadaceae bacterium]
GLRAARRLSARSHGRAAPARSHPRPLAPRRLRRVRRDRARPGPSARVHADGREGLHRLRLLRSALPADRRPGGRPGAL